MQSLDIVSLRYRIRPKSSHLTVWKGILLLMCQSLMKQVTDGFRSLPQAYPCDTDMQPKRHEECTSIKKNLQAPSNMKLTRTRRDRRKDHGMEQRHSLNKTSCRNNTRKSTERALSLAECESKERLADLQE